MYVKIEDYKHSRKYKQVAQLALYKSGSQITQQSFKACTLHHTLREQHNSPKTAQFYYAEPSEGLSVRLAVFASWLHAFLVIRMRDVVSIGPTTKVLVGIVFTEECEVNYWSNYYSTGTNNTPCKVIKDLDRFVQLASSKEVESSTGTNALPVAL